MTTTHTLTGDLRDVLSEGAKGISATLVTNLGDAALVDLDANVVHLPGPKRVPVNGTTFEVDAIATNSTGTNIEGESLRYQVQAQYVDAANVRRTWASPWFTLTADADLSDKVADEYLPPTIASATLAEMQALVEQAETITGLTGEDEAVAALIGDAGSDTKAALTAEIADAVPAAAADLKLVQGDGMVRNMRVPGDTTAGVLDWGYGAGVAGYLFHLRAQSTSTAAEAAIGIGTDRGDGGAILLALKNGGKGLSIGSHPSHSGTAIALGSYGKDAQPVDVSLYSGSKGLVIQQKQGAGFHDGATTSGSTTFTSATANFTAGDVGKTLTQLTSRGEAFGSIPTGATIATVTNSTTVVMSAPAGATSTGINFLLGGRVVPSTQPFIGFYNSSAERVFEVTPSLTSINATRTELFGGTSATAPSMSFNGNTVKIYTHNGTNYTAHEIYGDAFVWELRHYAAAGKGSESAPVKSIRATISGGTPRLSFFGGPTAAKPTVTGSKSDATAITSLLAALSSLGLVTDSTT